MNFWLKLGVPVLLGAGAAAINWQVLQSELEPHYFVKVKRDIKAGQLFKPDDFAVLAIKSQDGPGSLHGTAVRWANQAILYDAPCVRDLKTNDIVFMRDAPTRLKQVPLKKEERALQISLDNVKYEPGLLIVGNQIGFVVEKEPSLADLAPNTKKILGPRTYIVEGPFRIVSVGRRVNPQAEGDSSDTGGGRVISVAVTTESRDDGTETLDAQANRLLQAAAIQPGTRKSGIEAIVLYPTKN